MRALPVGEPADGGHFDGAAAAKRGDEAGRNREIHLVDPLEVQDFVAARAEEEGGVELAFERRSGTGE